MDFWTFFPGTWIKEGGQRSKAKVEDIQWLGFKLLEIKDKGGKTEDEPRGLEL